VRLSAGDAGAAAGHARRRRHDLGGDRPAGGGRGGGGGGAPVRPGAGGEPPGGAGGPAGGAGHRRDRVRDRIPDPAGGHHHRHQPGGDRGADVLADQLPAGADARLARRRASGAAVPVPGPGRAGDPGRPRRRRTGAAVRGPRGVGGGRAVLDLPHHDPPPVRPYPARGRSAYPTCASRALTSVIDGLVSAVPSGNRTVGTVRLPWLTLVTYSAAAASCSMSTTW